MSEYGKSRFIVGLMHLIIGLKLLSGYNSGVNSIKEDKPAVSLVCESRTIKLISQDSCFPSPVFHFMCANWDV